MLNTQHQTELANLVDAENLHYYLAFNHFNKFGPATLLKINQCWPKLAEAWQASTHQLLALGLNETLVYEFINWRRHFNLDQALENLAKNKIQFISFNHPNYPRLLKEIVNPPLILYFKGQFPASNQSCLAVVGSRKPSAYASKVLDYLLPPLISLGVEIVSGLAYGVDAQAHQLSLGHQGVTWAVLGSGLQSDKIYPQANLGLAQQIIEQGGVIISEFPPATPPLKKNFPQRNRIIAGLSRATLIIEAQARSGTLITANLALEQGREVLAVPGNIFAATSAGTNNLIKSGATPITCPDDLVEILQLHHSIPTKSLLKKSPTRKTTTPKQPQLQLINESELAIYQIIERATQQAEKISTDEIIKISRLDTATVNSTLSLLEIRGIVKNTEYGYDLN
jgi:DNA processing protein